MKISAFKITPLPTMLSHDWQYRIEGNVGRVKLWRIWRMTINFGKSVLF